MANNTNNETTFSNPIEKLLAISSGASLDILRECPRTEIIKHAGIGGTILLTSLLALISGSYALFSVFKSYPAAILFGLVWALMIFNLDRLIVSSMRKRGVWLQQIKMATPRILLAIIIAIVISKPLEVRLLETRINKVLSDDLANKKTSLEQEKQGIIDFYTGKIANQQEKTTNYLGEKPVLLESLETDKKALLVKKGIEEKKAAKRNASLFRAIELAQQKLTFNKTI